VLKKFEGAMIFELGVARFLVLELNSQISTRAALFYLNVIWTLAVDNYCLIVNATDKALDRYPFPNCAVL